MKRKTKTVLKAPLSARRKPRNRSWRRLSIRIPARRRRVPAAIQPALRFREPPAPLGGRHFRRLPVSFLLLGMICPRAGSHIERSQRGNHCRNPEFPRHVFHEVQSQNPAEKHPNALRPAGISARPAVKAIKHVRKYARAGIPGRSCITLCKPSVARHMYPLCFLWFLFCNNTIIKLSIRQLCCNILKKNINKILMLRKNVLRQDIGQHEKRKKI